jgi:hypothetical protein
MRGVLADLASAAIASKIPITDAATIALLRSESLRHAIKIGKSRS